ncbi:MAG: hypothetical protein LKJ32_05400 [Lactobacillus sp.]|jgi:hypothetical protein|nr:hypothetical protein [Lactobacillus sp.]
MGSKHRMNKTGIIISSIVGVFLIFVLVVVCCFESETDLGTKSFGSDGERVQLSEIMTEVHKVHITKVDNIGLFGGDASERDLVKKGELHKSFYRATFKVKISNLLPTKVSFKHAKAEIIYVVNGHGVKEPATSANKIESIEDYGTEYITMTLVSNYDLRKLDEIHVQFENLYYPELGSYDYDLY